MKDLPHHMKKLNRRVIRSEQREILTEFSNLEEELSTQSTRIERPVEQVRKQAKLGMKKETLSRAPIYPTEEERNQKMKRRVPIFDRLSHPRPKVGAKPKKKSPSR
jgi:hypothetical protein